MKMKYKQCDWCLEHIGGLNFWGNLGLAVIKLWAGIVGHSRALFADAVHSTADVITACFVIISLKYSKRPADERYPYGYGHIEFIVSTFIGIFILFVAFGICWSSILAVIQHELLRPGIVAIWATLISIAGNELMFRHSLCVAKEAASPVLVANAWENRGDAFSSVVALIGVVGARVGLRILDPIAAGLVGILIGRQAIKVILKSIKGLTDTSLSKSKLTTIRNLANSIEGVERVRSVKARQSGQQFWIDLEVCVSPSLSVAQGRNISQNVKDYLWEKIEKVGGITVRLLPASS